MAIGSVIKAVALGFVTNLALVVLGSFVATAFLGKTLTSEDVVTAAAIRVLATLAAGFVSGWVTRQNEPAVGFLAGASTSAPSLLLGTSGSLTRDLLELVIWAAIGSAGGELRRTFRLGRHRHFLFRLPVGVVLIGVGICLMVAMAVSQLLLVTSVLSHSTETMEIPLPVHLSLVVLGMVGLAMFWVGRRVIRAPAESILDRNDRPTVLFLRAFEDDRMPIPEEPSERGWLQSDVSDAMFRGFKLIGEAGRDTSFEGNLVQHLKRDLGMVVAVARPWETLPPATGAARLVIEGDDWQSTVEQLLKVSKYIVMVVGRGEGVAWELRQIFKLNVADRFLMVFPPIDPNLIRERWNTVREILVEQEEVCGSLPQEPPAGVRLMKFSDDGNAVFACDDRPTIEGYRSALLRITTQA